MLGCVGEVRGIVMNDHPGLDLSAVDSATELEQVVPDLPFLDLDRDSNLVFTVIEDLL
jgi:hypothetical protein